MSGSVRMWAVAGVVAAVVGGTTVALLVGAAGSGRSTGDGSPSGSSSPPAYLSASAARFPIVTDARVVVGGSPARVFVPLASSVPRPPERYPLAVVVPAAGVDASQYTQFAHDVGGYGFTVVVPSSPRGSAVDASVRWARAVDLDPKAAVHGLVDPSTIVVLIARGSGLDLCVPPDSRRPNCSASGAVTARLAFGDLGALALTDEGRRGPRVTDAPSDLREKQIERLARVTSWWALAHLGDTTASGVLTELEAALPSGISLRQSAP